MNLALIARQQQDSSTPAARAKMQALAQPALAAPVSGVPASATNTVSNALPADTGYDLVGQSSGQVNTGDSGSGTDYLNNPDLINADLSSLFANAGYTADPNISNTNTPGDSGGGTDDATGAALQNWLTQNGYSLGVKSTPTGSYTNLFNTANGSEVGGSKDIFAAPDTQDNAFGLAMLAAAGFATAGAAGAFSGAGDAAGAALPSTDAGLSDITGAAGYTAPTSAGTGGLAGTGIPALPDASAYSSFEPYQVAGDNAVAPSAATGGGITPAASSGYSLAGATPSTGGLAAGTSTGAATGAATADGGLLGTGLTTGQVATGSSGLAGLGEAASSAGSADGSGVISGGNGITPGTGTSGLQASGGVGTSLYNPSGITGGIDSSSLGLTPSSSSSPSWLSSLQSALTGTNGTGLSSLGKGLVGLGASGVAGAISGTGILGTGDTSALNSVNYQNAATAQGQSGRTDQVNSQGSLSYNQTGTDAEGNPTYTQASALNAPYQSNLNSALSNQSTALGNLNNYNSGLSAAYAAAPSLYGDAGSQADLVKQAQDAAYNSQTSYLDPQYAQAQKQLQAQLANQGVSYGSDAYNAAMTQFGTQQNQAYGTARDSAILQGDTYANTLFNQNLAANSQYNTNLNNQGTNYANQSANALTGVTQNPTFAATPAATNYLGAAQLQGQANLNQYNAKIGNTNNLTNGLTGIATAALGNQNVWNAIGSGVSGLSGFFSGTGSP